MHDPNCVGILHQLEQEITSCTSLRSRFELLQISYRIVIDVEISMMSQIQGKYVSSSLQSQPNNMEWTPTETPKNEKPTTLSIGLCLVGARRFELRTS